MNESLKNRFRTAYQKVFGLIPALEWDGTYYRSPHLPMAMTPRRMQAHVNRLETRAS